MSAKSLLSKAGGKVADGISRLSSLSPEQLQKVQQQRDEYLSQMPDPTDSSAEKLTERLLAANSIEIYKSYLTQLKELYVPIEREFEYGTSFDTARNIRFFNITKWVTDKNENSIEKLINVYQVLSNDKCNISLVFHRTYESTHVYLAVTNTQNADNNIDSENYRARLADAIRGNFPGSEWSDKVGIGVLPCLRNDIPYSVAIASNVPAEKSEKFISQTIEKLLDGIVPDKRAKEYIIILLATPVHDVDNRKLKLSEMYSGLAPYASWTTNFTYTEQNSAGSSATVGINIGASAESSSNQYKRCHGLNRRDGNRFHKRRCHRYDRANSYGLNRRIRDRFNGKFRYGHNRHRRNEQQHPHSGSKFLANGYSRRLRNTRSFSQRWVGSIRRRGELQSDIAKQHSKPNRNECFGCGDAGNIRFRIKEHIGIHR